MPCVYDDVPGSWGRQSEGWPQIQDADDSARKLVIANKLVPYGSYVTVDGYLRLETQEYVDIVRAAMRGAASPAGSSAAEEALMTAREIREANAAGAGIELITEAEEQRRAAEQAKPAAINPHEVDSKLIGEQAKPVAIEQAQAGELPPLPPVDGYDKRVQGHYSAQQMREYANACRLALAEQDARRLRAAIIEHNSSYGECDKKKCGYAPYKYRECPECPTQHKIDLAALDAAIASQGEGTCRITLFRRCSIRAERLHGITGCVVGVTVTRLTPHAWSPER